MGPAGKGHPAWRTTRDRVECAMGRTQRALTAGTIFHKTHKPVRLWFRARDYYLDGLTFRFNRRTSRARGKLFYRLVKQAAAITPAPYQALVGGRPQQNRSYGHTQPPVVLTGNRPRHKMDSPFFRGTVRRTDGIYDDGQGTEG